MSLEQAVFGRFLLPVAYRLTGNSRLQNIDPFLARERWTSADMERYQVDRLRELLVGAGARVPHFRDLFRSLGFDPSEVRSLQDLEAIPPMTRETLQRDVERFRDPSIPVSAIRRDATGGSTGTPVEFFHELRYRELAAGAALRTRMWGGWRPGSRTAWIWGAPQETAVWKTLRGRMIGWVSRNLYLDAFRAGPEEMASWEAKFRSFRPRFVYGYAGSIAHFAEFLRGRGAVIEGVQAVFSTAEKLHAWQREAIESAFHAPVLDHYGSREVKAIAAQCEAGGMHILSDLNIVEMENPDAEVSPLLVTCLENRAMPFVRYQIGDVGALKHGTCPCGRGLPLLELRIGRESDLFVTPEGRHVHGEYFTHLMYGMPGVRSFQFYQPSPDRVILRAVPDESFDEDVRRRLLALGARIRREVSSAIELEVALVDDIPPSPTGKFRFTWSDASAPVAPIAPGPTSRT
jgi:phenylacetate-CoA ligase